MISKLCTPKRSPRRVDAHNNQIYPDNIQRHFATKSLRGILEQLEASVNENKVDSTEESERHTTCPKN